MKFRTARASTATSSLQESPVAHQREVRFAGETVTSATAPRVRAALFSTSAWRWILGSWSALFLPTLIYPFARDQGLFAFVGLKMLEGQTLYRDLWDVKSPLTYLLYGLGLTITGNSEIGFRLFDAVIILFCAMLTYAVAKRVGARSERAAVLSAVIFLAAYYLPSDYRVLGNCEVFILPFMMLGLLMLFETLEKPSGLAAPLWTGIWLGITPLVKTTAAVLVVPALVTILLMNSESRSLTSRLRSTVLLALGYGLPLSLCVMYLSASGAWSEWSFINFVYLPYYTNLSHDSGMFDGARAIAYFLKGLMISYPALILGMFLFVYLWLTRRKIFTKDCGLTIVALFAGMYLGVVILQGKYLVYQFLPFFPTLAILAAVCSLTLLEDFRSGAVIRVVAFAAIIAAAIPLWKHVERYGDLIARVTHPGEERAYFQKISQGNYSCVTVRDVATYLRNNANPGDRMFAWTFSPDLYYLSGVANANRFLYNTVFLSGEIAGGYKMELMASLRRDPPRFFVTAEGDGLPLITGVNYSSRQRMVDVTGLTKFVADNYREVARFDNFFILERLERSSGVSDASLIVQ